MRLIKIPLLLGLIMLITLCITATSQATVIWGQNLTDDGLVLYMNFEEQNQILAFYSFENTMDEWEIYNSDEGTPELSTAWSSDGSYSVHLKARATGGQGGQASGIVHYYDGYINKIRFDANITRSGYSETRELRVIIDGNVVYSTTSTGTITIDVDIDDYVNSVVIQCYVYDSGQGGGTEEAYIDKVQIFGKAVDSSGDNDGTIYGATWVHGRYGYGLSFDGVDDYVEVPDNGIDLQNGFTISAWFYKRANPDTADVGVGQRGNNKWVGIKTNGKAFVQVVNENNVGRWAISPNPLDNNKWYHIVGVWEKGVGLRLYINGELVATSYFTEGAWNTVGNAIRIGTTIHNFADYFNGIIDEVRIYNRSLTADEIQQEYEKSLRTHTFIIADEKTGKLLKYNNSDLEYLRVYVLNSTYYKDLREENETAITITFADEKDVRFEAKYPQLSEAVTRDFNSTLLNESHIYVGFPEKYEQFYESMIISHSQRPVIVKNALSGVYITADYTKYTYEYDYVLPIHTVSGSYYLWTYENNQKVLLGLIDGATPSNINLDALDYVRKTYDISILSDAVAISRYDNTTLEIYYKNVANDNQQVVFKVNNSTETIWTHTETESPNEVTIYFDTTGLDQNETYTLIINETKLDGTHKEKTQMFTLSGESGKIPPGIVAVTSFMLALIGLTIGVPRHSFGVIGLGAIGAGLGLTLFAQPAWYINFTQAVLVILLVVVFVKYKNEYAGVK